MKRFLMGLFLSCWSMTAVGQEHLIKKLEQELKAHPKADTFRVNRLNKLGLIPSIPTGRRDTLSVEALTISRKLDYYNGEELALINHALVVSQEGFRDKAGLLFDQALALQEKIDDDELVVHYWLAMGRVILQANNQKALAYFLKADSLSKKLPNKELASSVQRRIASCFATSLSNYPKAIEWSLKAIKSAEEANSLNELALGWNGLATNYTTMGDNENGLLYFKKALEANKILDNKILSARLYTNIGERHRLMGNYPEAIKAYKQQQSVSEQTPYTIELNESNMADVYVRMGNFPLAFNYGFHSLKLAAQIEDTEGVAWISGILSRAYNKVNKIDSALYYANKGLEAAKKAGTIEFMRDNYGALADAYVKKNDFANAYKYQILHVAYRDSMLNGEVTNKVGLLQYNFDLAKKQAQIATLNQERTIQYYLLAGAAAIVLIVGVLGIILFKNNLQKQRANLLLSKQKKEIEEQQAQLVQKEKMASLGELTAGIAHEIQNPLNFVNNFSEVSIELLQELKEAEDLGNSQEVNAIADDLSQNLAKIKQHGKRAAGIVKSMLQHSRTTSGDKEPTNLNTIADEYARLAYHGLKAKDKSFNTELITNFDKKLPKVSIVAQDIGRVILNLVNNAFYATQQKALSAGADYKPRVEISTFRENESVKVVVMDNGNGIPANIREKIMQPFFTTKPPGEGTGLGLSLSYDIVVKGHGGGIEVDTLEKSYTEIQIILPLN